MASHVDVEKAREAGVVGFGVLDSKGRISLPKPVRDALGVHPGSSVAYILVDQTLMLIPQDEHLARLWESAAAVLEKTGLTAQDFLDELPAVRDQIMRETYGDEFMEELAREHAAIHGAAVDESRDS
jgi:AbrB family looped-hinge helix DNA binding protein